MVEPDSPEITMQHMHIACWTHIHSEYVILIAFPQQQWLCGHNSVLCLYVHCPSSYTHINSTSSTVICLLGLIFVHTKN
jgi:hypothetical protein